MPKVIRYKDGNHVKKRGDQKNGITNETSSISNVFVIIILVSVKLICLVLNCIDVLVAEHEHDYV